MISPTISPQTGCLKGGCARDLCSLLTLPKSPDLAPGATGQPLPEGHSRTEPRVLAAPDPAATAPAMAPGGHSAGSGCAGSAAPARGRIFWSENSVLRVTV